MYKSPFKPNRPSLAVLHFPDMESLKQFHAAYNSHVYVDSNGNHNRCLVEASILFVTAALIPGIIGNGFLKKVSKIVGKEQSKAIRIISNSLLF